MALRRCDSFSHYTSFAHKWRYYNSGSGGTFTIETGVNPWGGNTVSWGTSSDAQVNNYVGDLIGANAATIILGCRMRLTQVQTRTNLFGFLDTGTYQVSVGFDSSFRVNAYSGGGSTSLGNSGAYSFPSDGSYHYVEVKVVIHNTTGSVEVRVDNTVVLNLTNINTRAGTTNAYANQFRLGGAGQDYIRAKICDLYVCDDSGAANNDFLGDVRVECLFPDGAGDSTQFTPSAGSNYQNVDESAPNSDTDYNSSNTVGQKDLFTVGNLSGTSGTIAGVQVVAIMRKDDAGTRAGKTKVKSGTTEAAGSDLYLSTNYGPAIKMHETNPDTAAAWTPTQVNSVQVGYEVAA